MLKWYGIKIVNIENVEDSCWTMLESEGRRAIERDIKAKWGDEYRVVEVKPLKPFYQELNANDPVEAAKEKAERGKQMSAANQKTFCTPQGEFPSIKLAIKGLGITAGKMSVLRKKFPKEYYKK